MACTGSEFCRFAVIETKERAVRWAARPRRGGGWRGRRRPGPRPSGAAAGGTRRPGSHPAPRFGLLGLLRPAPDRRHRVSGRGRPSRPVPERGRRHRGGRLARPGRGLHRLGGRAPARRRGPGGAGPGARALPGRAAPGRALLRLGAAHPGRRGAPDARGPGRRRPQRGPHRTLRTKAAAAGRADLASAHAVRSRGTPGGTP